MRWLMFIVVVLNGRGAIKPEPVKQSTEVAPALATLQVRESQPAEPTDSSDDKKETSANRDIDSTGKKRGRDLPPDWREQFTRQVDQVAPRIDRITPPPGAWIVDNEGLREVRIGFTEQVTIPPGSLAAWKLDLTEPSFTTSLDTVTNTLTITFTEVIRDTRLTLLVDFTIIDLAGNELDGEIGNPAHPVLPSGDGVRGGQAVFRFNILQGDANRDGITNSADATIIRDLLGLCVDDAEFDPHADLNEDGCVNALDVAIFSLANGRALPAMDGQAPILVHIFQPPISVLDSFDTLTLELSEAVVPIHLSERSCYLIDADGNLIIPTFYGQAAFGDVVDFFFIPPVEQCGTYTINLTNSLPDLTGALLVRPSTPPILTGLVPPPAPTLNAHTTSTTADMVTVTGTAPGAVSVEVSHAAGVPFTVAVTNNSFTANVPLANNRINPIFFTALSTCDGVRSAPRITRITRDNDAPNLYIDFPVDGASITTNTTDVAGRVGDILSGYLGLVVTVEVLNQSGMVTDSATATVNEGVGNNGTFFAAGTTPGGPNVSLNPNQQNTIRVTATDQRNNSVTKQIMVTQTPVPANTPQMVIVNGNGQSGPIASVLGNPIEVRMTKQDGTPFVNKVVTFKVTRSNGRLTAAPPLPGEEGKMMVQVHTDATGLARTYWRLGTDAGFGNNRVTVTSQSIAGTVVFCASATAGAVKQINIGSGNNQKAEAGGPAAEPLRVWVSDGCNGKPGQLVAFTVTRGGGKVRAPGTTLDLDSVTVQTGDTGHAAVNFSLGPNQGSNAIEARLVNYPNLQPARFVIYGLVRDPLKPTTFTGIVLNNAGQPIENAQCILVVGIATPLFVYSDIQGRFRFDNVTGSGDADLYVNGATAIHVGGPNCTDQSCDVALNTFPSLHFEMVVVPNAENSLPMPVMLPPLNPHNVVTTYSATPGGPDTILKVEGMEGLEMRVKAGSMTLGNGQPAPNGQPIYLNQVHEDAIPMPIPDGASPPFTWTLQPAGSKFNPPIEIQYPNMSGLPAGSIAYFLSFNHDTSRFEIIASGHVTDDGAYILTDPGAGLGLAGWGCNCPPYSVTGECCTGCDADCCDGVCCGCACCAGKCCNGRCCTDCCGGQCCSGECCNGQCCSGGKKCCEGKCCKDCCDGKCCDGVCCNGICCPAGQTCCDGRCCPSACCEEIGLCCPPGNKSCCGGKCCPGPCCEEIGLCCGAQFTSCCNNQCCIGECCEDGFGGEECCGSSETCCDQQCCPGACCSEACCTGIPCCDENGSCCEGECCGENNDQCCELGGECCLGQNCCAANAHCCINSILGHCCPNGEACCGPNNCCDEEKYCADQGTGLCCDLGVASCGLFGAPKHCCNPGQVCCNNGQCCDFPCDQCLNNGTLSGGMIEVEPEPACVGQTVTFTVSGVTDSGGLKRIDCHPTELPGVQPTYTWVITGPLGSRISGTGPVAMVIPTVVGSYCVTFTATANRECPPPPHTVDPLCTVVRNVNLIFDGLPEELEEVPGGLICVNNDDDDMSVRADKDDDPGPILNENDLKTLQLTLNGVTPQGTGTLNVMQGAGGFVRVYFNPNRFGPVPLPFMFSGTDLPITLYVEGYSASAVARDVTAEMVYTLPDGGVCKDKVNISVGGVEFESAKNIEFMGNVHRKMDLINLVNPNPLVQLNADALPATGAPVVFPISGQVTNHIAPLTMQDVTINDQPVQSLQLISSGPLGLGPFIQSFSRNVTLPDHDLLIKAKATNALRNSGWHKQVVIADFDCELAPLSCPGTFLSRSTRPEDFTPREVGNVERFSVAVVDPFAAGNVITVQIDTGVEQRTLQLARVQGTIRFVRDYLYLVPENLNLPAGTPQGIVNTRLKGRLGKQVRSTYTLCGNSGCQNCEDNALTVGIMFVVAGTGQPVDVALAGLPKDVLDGGVNRQPLNMVAGLPGDSTSVVQDGARFKLFPKLIARDYRDDPDPNAPGSETFVDLFRVSDDPRSPDFNLFKSDPAAPLLPLASEANSAPVNPNLTVRNVHSGGFLRLEDSYEFGVLQAVEPIKGPIVVNVLVDGLGSGFPQASFAPAVPPNFQTMLAAGSLPNFVKLIGDGAHSVQRYDGNTTFPSITFSAWSSWATGKEPGIHGVTGSNFFRRDRVNDQYWCGPTPDPTCDASGGMWTPVDHVSFHGPSYPIADLDVENVWSSIGTLNAAIRPDVATLPGRPNVFTLYEALAAKGIRSAVVYHFVHRGVGVLDKEFPTAFGGFIDHADNTGTALDDGTTVELTDLLDPDPAMTPHIRPPQVLTVYYAGLDTNVHNNPNYPAVGATQLIKTDRYLGTLVRLLEQWNLMDEAMFTFTGDHGLTNVVKDDTHSLLFKNETTTPAPELLRPFQDLGYNLLEDAFQIDYDSVLTVNGGMAHVYVRNRESNWWPDAPRYVEDVLPLAERFYDHTVGNVTLSLLKDSIELVLVRDSTGPEGWNAPYRIGFRTKLTAGSFVTISLSGALGFTHPTNGLPLVPSGYLDLVNNMQRLQDIRSGDIILLSNYSKKHRNAIASFEEGDPQNRDGGYYFGGQLYCWHGSLYDTDMTVPIAFSFPRGEGALLTTFLQTVNGSLPAPPANARIIDLTNTAHKLLTEETLP
jgi:predicted AlkP superfamily pyrophosphatase or phosphodiesterase